MKAIIISAIVMTVLDAIYLTTTRKMMENQIRIIQNKDLAIRVLGAVACYFFLVFGLYYFIIKEKRSILDAFLFGLVVYGVYETTNYAIFKNWKLLTVFIDILWGGTLMATTTYITYKSLNL